MSEPTIQQHAGHEHDEIARDSGEATIAEIVSVSGICGGLIPSDPLQLWSEIAIWRNISPGPDAAINAKNAFESFGEPWDEDFLNDDNTPSLAALETIHSLILRQVGNSSNAERIEAEDEEDEEDAEFAAGDREIVANTSLWNILTVVEHIVSGRINLNPDWQRSFVWKQRKQKALIESILLGLPIPSFLLYKDRETGQMSVIDGRQRLETISRFTHQKEKKGEPKIRFRTCSATQEGWRPGQMLNPAAGKFYQDLPGKFRAQFDTQNLQVAILDVPLEHLYQIFKRYNTGSVALNAAEIRNAVFQTSDLHAMMFRLGGEHRDQSKYKDKEEARVGEDLRSIMKNKQNRYGAYDFIGRVLGFTYETTGTVAKATFSFMGREHRARLPTIEAYRREFIDSFEATTEWYEYPLTEPKASGAFHSFLATIQMVSTTGILRLIREGAATEAAAKQYIQAHWREFAEGVLSKKQNSTNFWSFQKEWIQRLTAAAKTAT